MKGGRFGTFFKRKRMESGLTLREFCRENGFDAGNVSRMERGLARAPQSPTLKAKYAAALGIKKGTDDWLTFLDLAAVDAGRIPDDFREDERLLRRLPLLFGTARSGGLPALGSTKLVGMGRGGSTVTCQGHHAMARESTSGYGGGEIILYREPDGSMQLDVRLERETIWLTQKQLSLLFATERSVITKHLRNIFSSKELDRESVCALLAHTAADGKTYQVEHFNLDAIISVGYRVNSKRGTQFRMWATRVLRDHILKGYSVNERRLRELRQSLKLVGKVLNGYDVTSDETKALLHVVTDYSRALDLLDDYDHQRVPSAKGKLAGARGIDYDEARRVIDRLRVKFRASELFGREKDESLRSSLAAVMQTFGGKDLYPSLEGKAAHLLYFLVKNHSFVDGNKRIAAALFLWFMEKNGLLYRDDGTKRVADNALVAITLMIAASDPAERDAVVNVTMILIGAIT